MYKLKLSLKIFIFIFLSLNAFSKEVKIIAKIENDIITNLDVENESRYLRAFNKSLSQMNNNQILEIAKKSIIRERIKKIEISKYTDLNKKDELYDNNIRDIYQRLGINSENEFKLFLKEKDLNYSTLYKKIEIETLWNQLIYSIYSERIKIDENNLKKKIISNQEKQKRFRLSEIVFEIDNKNEINTKYNKIKKSIEESGFKKSVQLFSISDSKNNEGSIGWVNENILSNKLKKEINSIKINEITEPIIIPSGILILRLDEIDTIDAELDLEKELRKLIEYETNYQLNTYSNVHYNKIKKDIIVNEY